MKAIEDEEQNKIQIYQMKQKLDALVKEQEETRKVNENVKSDEQDIRMKLEKVLEQQNELFQ